MGKEDGIGLEADFEITGPWVRFTFMHHTCLLVESLLTGPLWTEMVTLGEFVFWRGGRMHYTKVGRHLLG